MDRIDSQTTGKLENITQLRARQDKDGKEEKRREKYNFPHLSQY